MSLYSKQLSLLVLWQNFKVLVAFRDGIETAFSSLVSVAPFPKAIAKL